MPSQELPVSEVHINMIENILVFVQWVILLHMQIKQHAVIIGVQAHTTHQLVHILKRAIVLFLLAFINTN